MLLPATSTAAVATCALGVGSALGGAAALLFPHRAFDFLGLASRSRVPVVAGVLRGWGLAAVATGAYYVLAARQNNRAFFFLAAPLHLAAAAVFWRDGAGAGAGPAFRNLAIIEGCAGLLTGAALLFDFNKRRLQQLLKRNSKGGAGGGGGTSGDNDDVRETEGSEGEGKRRRFRRKGTKKSKD